MIVRLLFFFPESEKSNHDNEPLGRTGVCACVLYITYVVYKPNLKFVTTKSELRIRFKINISINFHYVRQYNTSEYTNSTILTDIFYA